MTENPMNADAAERIWALVVMAGVLALAVAVVALGFYWALRREKSRPRG